MKNQVAVKAVVKDLVCGMDVETATAAGHSEYKGHTYYF
jgi:YHS domain-containing protein